MEKKNKKSMIIGITGLILVTLTLLGLTYAYYRTRIVGNENDTSVSVTSKKLEVIYEDDNAVVTAEGVEPGFKTSKEFTVTNNGSEGAYYSIILDNITNTFQRNEDWKYTLYWSVVEIDNESQAVTRAEQELSMDSNRTIVSGSHQIIYPSQNIEYIEGKTVVHKYRLEIEYVNEESIDQSEDMGQSLSFRINIGDSTVTWFNAQFPSVAGEATAGLLLQELAFLSVKEPTTIPGRVASGADEAVFASTEDDYGTSYYFRGAVTNNYVNFSGMCWRIVRVQGDGSIKLVLADRDNECNAAGYSASNTSSAFMNSSQTLTPNNLSLSNIFAEMNSWLAEKNINTTNLITDEWCVEDIVANDVSYGYNSDYSQKVYDKSLAVEGSWNTILNYAAYNRVFKSSVAAPTLKCNTTDSNGVSSTKIKNAIGLLTVDEMAFAGAKISRSYDNDATGGISTPVVLSHYLVTNASISDYLSLTMSPAYYYEYLGSGSNYWAGVDNHGEIVPSTYFLVRPSVVLRSDVRLDSTISGQNGTQTNPFVIS